MIVATFYSYKGGTGRTTLLANVAYQLALRGKRVLCADFDIDGPGLTYVLQLSMLGVGERNIVEYLRSSDEVTIEDSVVEATVYPPERPSIAVSVLPAPVTMDRQRILDEFTGDQLNERVATLCEQAEEAGYDFLLVDSSAGFDQFTSLAFAIADLVLVCLRWSNQHVNGTIQASLLLGEMLGLRNKAKDEGHEPDFPLKDFWLVASGVPEPKNEMQIARRDRKQANLNEQLAAIRSNAACRGPVPEMLVVKENDDLKWDEEVVLSEKSPTFAEFDRIVESLSKFADGYKGRKLHQREA